MTYIMGKNCVREVLRYKPQKIIRVFITNENQGSLIEDIKTNNIPFKVVAKQVLTSMVNSDSHQSIVAEVRQRDYVDLKAFLSKQQEKDKSLVLMLDNINDPQNFGSILRSCECFGVDGVVWSKNRGCDVSAVVTKSSCGASELIDLIRVSNLMDAINKFKDEGYEIITTLAEESSKSLYEYEFSDKTVIVMGSEGEGVQPIIRKNADNSVYIPLLGKIDSLNVSQATAVVLSYIRCSAMKGS